MRYNNKKEATIETLGAIGIGISIFCLLQLMIFLKRTNFFVVLLIISYLISITAYVLYFKMRSIYIYFLGIAAFLTLGCTLYFLLNGGLSPLQMILMVLNIVVFLTSFEMKQLHYIKEIEAYKKS